MTSEHCVTECPVGLAGSIWSSLKERARRHSRRPRKRRNESCLCAERMFEWERERERERCLLNVEGNQLVSKQHSVHPFWSVYSIACLHCALGHLCGPV